MFNFWMSQSCILFGATYDHMSLHFQFYSLRTFYTTS
jgi:hypothetical protein